MDADLELINVDNGARKRRGKRLPALQLLGCLHGGLGGGELGGGESGRSSLCLGQNDKQLTFL